MYQGQAWAPVWGAVVTSRIYGGETPELRVARRRSQFIEAGLELFGTVGYRKTTMRALCKQASLTDRYFYESFETIEDLLVAVYEQVISGMQQSLMTAMQQAMSGGQVEQVITTGLDAFFRQVEDTRSARVVWLEVLGVSPRVDQLYNSTLRNFADLLLNLARSLLKQNNLPDGVGKVVSMGMIGAASETAKDWMMSGYQLPREDVVQGIAMIYIGMIQQLGGK